jgi:hypothetical protein
MDFLVIATSKWHPDDAQPNVVVPFTNDANDPMIHRAMRLNLEMQGLRPRYERLNGTIEEEYAYDRLFRRLWAEGQPFILVEHDVLPWPGAVQALWACERPWCGFQYLIMGEMRVQLGCVKFDPARLGACPLPDGELVSWNGMDWRIIRALAERDASGHLHEPPVSHLNYGHQRMTAPLVLRPESVA